MGKIKINWKEAEEIRPITSRNKPEMRLDSLGIMKISLSFIDKYNLREKNFIKLLIIKKDKRIFVGLRFLDSEEPNSLVLLNRKRKKGFGFSARSLLNQLEIDREKIEPLDINTEVQYIDRERIFVFELTIIKK